MSTKKNKGRFSIKFNEHDPAHQAVIDLLEQQGPRQKAQFIANAVLHYIHCPETPDIHLPQTVDRAAVEAIVLEILNQQRGKENKESRQSVLSVAAEKPPKKPVADKEVVGTEESIDAETLKLISNTMAGFRCGGL